MMNRFTVLLAILAIVVSALACQAAPGGGGGGTSQDETFGSDGDFPMPGNARNVVSAMGTLNFQTTMSLDEVMAFYRDAYGKQGYTERSILTVVSDGVFSMVFDGDPSGQAVVIQGVDLGDGTMNVNIRLEDT
jgi:hypothetical protein